MKKNNPLVSVIMSEYNTEQKLLKESIRSILEQTYNNFELIIIDDCGKNNLDKIIKEFNDNRIKLYKNKKNMGLVYSLNKAIRLSQGKYIARMDTDDYCYKNRLEIQVKFLENNKDIDVLGGNCDYYDGNEIWGRSKLNGLVSYQQIINSCPFIHPTIMIKKEVFDEIDGYLNYSRSEDYATWIELYVNNYKLYNIDNKLIRYHLSKKDYKKRTLKTRKGFFKMLKEEYIKLKPTKIQLIKIYIKTFIAGIMPYSIMFLYHKRKNK